jgi:transcription antitermination factor NusG
MMIQNWYILYTSPRFEKRVKERLEWNGVDCYLPLHRCPRVWSDRVKMVDMPLFNSYIFVRCKQHEIMSLLRITGVVRVVFYNGHPAIVRQQEIDAIKQFIEKAKEKVLCTGDEVEILTGSMKNKSGKIVKIKKKYLILHIEQLAATVCINTERIAPMSRLK